MTQPRSNRTRPLVLLTGASGVVGQALLAANPQLDLVCLVHRNPVAGRHATAVRGDILGRDLGLGKRECAALAREVDAVVHAAAVTEFRGDGGILERTNVAGTAAMVDFAQRAEVPLYHVSTAFVGARPSGSWGATSTRYAASKREAEAVVRGSDVPHLIIRPSVVIGDSATGVVSAFQGLYQVAGAILDGLVPMIPFDPTWPMDFVTGDVLARVIATAVRQGMTGSELWVTSGRRAPSLGEAVELCVEVGRDLGLEPQSPRFIPPETFERLVAPVFLEALPRRIRLTVLRLLDFFAAYLALEEPLPESPTALHELGVGALPDPLTALRASLTYWAAVTGRQASKQVA
jgi:thioester reductase-like protein